MTETRDDLEAMRRRVAALEAENEEMRRRSGAAVARAERQAAWLDELGIDLNALMAKRGADELRATFRAARNVYWMIRYRLPRRVRSLRDRT